MLTKIPILAVILTAICSVLPKDAENQSRVLPPIDLDMRSRGDCLPFEIAAIRVTNVIHVSDSQIVDLAFMGASELLVSDSSSRVFWCDVASARCDLLLTMEENRPSPLTPLSRAAFIVSGQAGEKLYGCFNREGELVWSLPWERYIGPPVLDGSSVLVPTKSYEGETAVVVLSLDGQVIQTIDSGLGEWSQLLSCSAGVLVIDLRAGPNLLVRSPQGYVIERWHAGWDEGTRGRYIVDSLDRIISLEAAMTELVILDRMQPEPETILVWGSELGVSGQADYPYPVDVCRLASNGETIAVVQPNSLLRYSNGALSAWIDDFSALGVEYIALDFYVDATCERFLILDLDRLLLGGEDVQVIDLGHRVRTGLEFSEDLEVAAVGTYDGNIILIEIEKLTARV